MVLVDSLLNRVSKITCSSLFPNRIRIVRCHGKSFVTNCVFFMAHLKLMLQLTFHLKKKKKINIR